MSSKMAEKDFNLNRVRLDFVIEEVKEVDKTKKGKVLRMKLKLDPKVWEYDEKNKVYINKKQKIILPEKVLKEATPTLNGKPIYLEDISQIVEENDNKYLKELKSRHEKNSKDI